MKTARARRRAQKRVPRPEKAPRWERASGRERARGLIGLLVLVVAGLAGIGPAARTGAAGGTPQLRVEPGSVAFAPVAIGSLATAGITLHNDGSAALVLGQLATDHPDFTAGGPSGAPPPGTSVAAGDSLPLALWFRPSQPDTTRAALTIPSNDPLVPQATVALVGVALGPPAASVSPASFTRTVLTGTTQTDSLVIRNGGTGPLQWQLSVLPAPAGSPARAALDGVRILWDRSRNQVGTTIAWSTIVSDLQARGATLQEVPLGTVITDSLLAGAQVFWTVDVSAGWTAVEGAALGGWIAGGGGLLVIGDNSSSITPFNDLLTDVESAIRWSPLSANGDDLVMDESISAHRITEGVDKLYVGPGVRKLEPIVSPATGIVRDSGDATIVAVEGLGLGRLAAVTDEMFDDGAIAEGEALGADNRLFGNQVVEWLAGERWLSADVTAGSVAAGDSAVVTLTFDPGDLGTGEHDLLLRVATNDPLNPQFDLPAHLTVIGVPGISVAPPALDFGAVEELHADSLALVVTNSGTEALTVSDIQSSSPVFVAAPVAFTLSAGEAESVSVRFTPDALATWSESLTVVSDAPADPALVVPLSGTGVTDCAAPCLAPALRPATVEGGDGFAFWLDVALDQAPAAIRSFGFELTWDPAHLVFQDSTLTDGLTSGFVVLAQGNEPGRLTCGGFSTDEIPAGASGSLVKLRFTVECDTCTIGAVSELRIENPIEDLAGVRPCCSLFTVADCPAGDGDVNADGLLSARDALCALKIFLNGQSVPADTSCDVNGECEVDAADVGCDGSVTPGDALAIHERVLCVVDPVPLPCFDQSEPDPCGSGLRAGAAVRLGEASRTEDGALSVPVLAEGEVRAFGLELVADGPLELVRLERGAAAAGWPGLEAAVEAGVLRVGGFGPAVAGELVRIVVRAAGELRVTGAVDAALIGADRVSLPATRVAAGIAGLGPVPSAGPVTIAWAAARTGEADLAIHDVAGRRIRTLERGPIAPGSRETIWDGRDDAGRRAASGLYFAVLRTDGNLFTRKVVLLR